MQKSEIDYNVFLGRTEIAKQFSDAIKKFEYNIENIDKIDQKTFKRGIYIQGPPGVGKSEFAKTLLNDTHDIRLFDAGTIRNKTVIETISKENMPSQNIMSLFLDNGRKIAILMDEIESFNNDKAAIKQLTILVRPKKNKKQLVESVTNNPIIFIGDCHVDKQLKDLMKVCIVIELKVPTNTQISAMIYAMMPTLPATKVANLTTFIDGDLRRLNTVRNMYAQSTTNLSELTDNMLKNVFQPKLYNDDPKIIVKHLLNAHHKFDDHLQIMNETDRTSVGLIWHENIIDPLFKLPKETAIPVYLKILENICIADYADRITFQKQIWQFKEMSSIIKTFKNNALYHASFKRKPKFNPVDIRFTKVLTNYSTEFSNMTFIAKLCKQLSMDRSDLIGFFLHMRDNPAIAAEIMELYEITGLEISRFNRYLNKHLEDDELGEMNGTMCDESDDSGGLD